MPKIDPRKQISNIDNIANIKELSRIMNRLDDTGRQLLLKALNENLSEMKKQKFLAELRSVITGTDQQIKDWLIKSISGVYISGMNFSQKVAEINIKKGILKLPSAFKQNDTLLKITTERLNTVTALKPHLEAVNTLMSNAYLDFGNSMTGYIKGAERLMNEAMKRQIRSGIAAGRLEGASIREIKNTIKNTMGDKGFTVLLDRGGRQWTLGNYSEMLARTHIMKANNEGTINRASDFGVDIMEFSDIGTDCPICAPYEGKCFSISGNSDNYPSLNGNEPPFHPNCRHNLFLRPDLK